MHWIDGLHIKSHNYLWSFSVKWPLSAFPLLKRIPHCSAVLHAFSPESVLCNSIDQRSWLYRPTVDLYIALLKYRPGDYSLIMSTLASLTHVPLVFLRGWKLRTQSTADYISGVTVIAEYSLFDTVSWRAAEGVKRLLLWLKKLQIMAKNAEQSIVNDSVELLRREWHNCNTRIKQTSHNFIYLFELNGDLRLLLRLRLSRFFFSCAKHFPRRW